MVYSKKEKVLKDEQLGEILFRKNERARKYIIRIKPGMVCVTIPRYGNYSYAEKFFNENRKLIAEKKEMLQNHNTSFEPLSGQNELELRMKAKVFLPGELERLAKEHGFEYGAVKINKSKTRWGSCSSHRNINLSFYLMTLPPHLIEYVLLHELCHTIHLNHSPAFWNLLDKTTNGKVNEFRQEIKKYRYNW